jgi:hypothetical protein
MTMHVPFALAVAILSTGCEVGVRPSPFVIPGPTVPSSLPTTTPYVWDTREELAIWVDNPVARGPLATEGVGSDAFIRIDRADRAWLVRGPDLTPVASAVQTVRLRYRWRLDPSLPPTAAQTASVTANCQTTTLIHSFDPTAQAAAHADLEPRADWTDVGLVPGQFKPPIDVVYCYIHSSGANRGVLEIDRIELAR